MTDKIIVSNDGALKKKYGVGGFAKIHAAINRLIAADKRRGLGTSYISLDDAAAMKWCGGRAVRAVNDEKGTKAAIDAIFGSRSPDYLMILGAGDVVALQHLRNPVYNPGRPEDDEDEWVPSDLPYASRARWSDRIQPFIAPTRVIGRLPDHPGASSPAFLLRLLGHAIAPAQTPDHAMRGFSLSAEVWVQSTTKSMRKLMPAAAAPYTSPAVGPRWSAVQLRPRLHFINCHGAKVDFKFYGESKRRMFPDAHDASLLTKKIPAGTVAAVECCYGAELYDPGKSANQQAICFTYLDCGAGAYLGSTTIAYGPPKTNAYADIICRTFLDTVLKGRSTGYALLSARLSYARTEKPIDPVDLKTLAQFILLGDPSHQPVIAQPKGAARKSRSVARSKRGRLARRDESRKAAEIVEATTPVTNHANVVPEGMRAMLRDRLRKAAGDVEGAAIMSFQGAVPATAMAGFAKAVPGRGGPTFRTHIICARPGRDQPDPRVPRHPVLVVATERDDKLLWVETVYGKGEAGNDHWTGHRARRRRRIQERPPRGHARE